MLQTSRIICGLTAVLLSTTFLGCASLPSGPRVAVDTGRLQGVQLEDVHAFRGIPYAAAPVGEWRWRPPQPVNDWVGVRDATVYAPHCAQFDSPILWFELDASSEDCLTLNVITPAASNEQLPVMLWIHGGGYSNGSGNIARLNSEALARQGVVLVTVNYRLSIFGFLTHPALAASHPDEPAGNMALLDLIAALNWVRRNIAAFGGDPKNVTIFGESAGAGLVNTLMVMPLAKGLFHKAISESASVGLAPDPYSDRQAGFLPPSNNGGTNFAKRLGIADYESESTDVADKLRSFSTSELLAALTERDRFTPVVDGEILPDQVGTLTAAGHQHAVPYITGGNSWEASLGRQIGGGFSPEFSGRLVAAADKQRLYPDFSGDALNDQIFGDLIVLSGSRYYANQMSKLGVPVYSYFFSYVAESRREAQPGAAHTDDIAFVMQTLDNEQDLKIITNRDREISALMSAYWVQFAKTGNPNGADLPNWPEYDEQGGRILEIGDEITVHEHLLGERMKYHIERGVGLLAKARK